LNPALKCQAIVNASRCDGQTPFAPFIHPKLPLAGWNGHCASNLVPFQNRTVYFETHLGKSRSFPFKEFVVKFKEFVVKFKGFAKTGKGHTGKSQGRRPKFKGFVVMFKDFAETSKVPMDKSKDHRVMFKMGIATGEVPGVNFKGRRPIFKGKMGIGTWPRRP
jgi:hypothetical protein